MKAVVVGFILAGMLFSVGPARAEDGSYNGLTWGYTRTYWTSSVNDEGYAEAGTAGPMIALRRVRHVGENLVFAPYLQYFGMRSSVTTLDCDTCNTVTQRTYFREIDLGFNFQYFPASNAESFYVGGGPSIRWGQAGRRARGEERPGDIAKGTWFGLTALAGLQRKWGDRAMVIFEPQLLFSPDFADRWQKNYPPVNLNVQMGILWK